MNMDEYLPFVSLDVWTMIFTWANLLILFLLLKKFLFKPINKVLDERARQIESDYKAAEDEHTSAQKLKKEYEDKLKSAKAQADDIIKAAVDTANERSSSIVSDANSEARSIIEKSNKQIERDKEATMQEIKKDIASIAMDAAEKILMREIDKSTDEKIISEIINKI